MTYRSLTVEAHPDQESAHAPYVVGAGRPVIGSLNAYTFPLSVVSFATEHGFNIDHIDNCWVRVAMDGRSLSKYIAFGVATERGLEPLTGRIDLLGWYVVSEEEF